MSLSHFMVPHLLYEKNLNQSIHTVIGNFIQEGGDINNAEFRIYGGEEGRNSVSRSALKKQLIKRDIPEARIFEPKGHETKENPLGFGGESTDYLFDRDGVTFRKMTLASLSSGNDSLDEVSGNLKNGKGEFDPSKVGTHQNFLENQIREVESHLIHQTMKVESDLDRGQKILKSVSENIKQAGEDQKKIVALARIMESQVLPMSLKVCGKDGLFPEGLQLVEVQQMTKNNNQKSRT